MFILVGVKADMETIDEAPVHHTTLCISHIGVVLRGARKVERKPTS